MQISTADWYPRFHEAQIHCEGNAQVAEVLAVLDALRTAAVAWKAEESGATMAGLFAAIEAAGGALDVEPGL